MPDDPDPAAIARRLTPAQRRALLWLPEKIQPATADIPSTELYLRVVLLEEDGLAHIEIGDGGKTLLFRASPLGLRVRAELEKEAGHG